MKVVGAQRSALSVVFSVVRWLLVVVAVGLFVFALISSNWWFVAGAAALMLLSNLFPEAKKRAEAKRAESWAVEALGVGSRLPPLDARLAFMRFANSTASTPDAVKASFQDACRNWSERHSMDPNSHS